MREFTGLPKTDPEGADLVSLKASGEETALSAGFVDAMDPACARFVMSIDCKGERFRTVYALPGTHFTH